MPLNLEIPHNKNISMKVNFEIVHNSALNIDNREVDLHNNFDFISFEYTVHNRELKLTWKKTIGDWVPSNEFNRLTLTHKQVEFLNIDDRDKDSLLVDDATLGNITFFPSSVREMSDSIVPQAKPNEQDDIIYTFENGQIIRISCEEIVLVCE
jgi:hypothetical protein